MCVNTFRSENMNCDVIVIFYNDLIYIFCITGWWRSVRSAEEKKNTDFTVEFLQDSQSLSNKLQTLGV